MTTVASSDSVAVAVHQLDGRGPTLLIAHATGFHARCYAPLASRLAQRFTSVALDVRGHGQTAQPAGWDGEPVDWRGCADDVVAVLDTLQAPVVGFGHSMGGTALLIAAARRPLMFERLVAYEPVLFPDLAVSGDAPHPDSMPLAVGARRRRRWFASIDAAEQHYASKPPLAAFETSVLRQYVEFGFRPGTDGGFELCCTPEFEAATFAGAVNSGAWDLLPTIDVPVVVAAGHVVAGQPSGDAMACAARLPRGEYRSLPHTTHFAPFTHIADVADLIASPTVT